MSWVNWTTPDRAFEDYWELFGRENASEADKRAVKEVFSFGMEAAAHFSRSEIASLRDQVSWVTMKTGITKGTERIVFTHRPMGDDCRENPDATEYAVTPGGIDYESEKEALYDYVVGCTCGRPWDVEPFLVKCLECVKDFDEPVPGRGYKGVDGIRDVVAAHPDVAAEFIAHALADRGLTEYGGSVYGAWLTPRGRQFLEVVGGVA